MTSADIEALQALLVRACKLYEDLDDSAAGVAVLHMDAVVAALESQIRRCQAMDGRTIAGDYPPYAIRLETRLSSGREQ